MRALEQANILAPCGGDWAGCVQMARPAEQVRVSDVMIALRGNAVVPLGMPDLSRTVNGVIGEIERAGGAVADTRTLRDLLDEAQPA